MHSGLSNSPIYAFLGAEKLLKNKVIFPGFVIILSNEAYFSIYTYIWIISAKCKQKQQQLSFIYVCYKTVMLLRSWNIIYSQGIKY